VTSVRSNLQYFRRVVPIFAAVALCTGVLVVAPLAAAPPAAAASSCSAAYSVTSQWSDGFGASITITNTGPAITAWTLQYTYPGNQQLTDGWDGTWSQSGETVTVTNASWNGTLAANASTTIGANFSYTGTNTAPAAISCAGNGSSGGGSGGGGSGGQTSFTQADINAAVAAPLIAFAAPTAAVPRPGTSPTNIYEAKILYYLALVEYKDPSATASNGTTVESALLAQVANLVAGGNEPDADGGLEGWAHAPVAQALLLLKNGPAWNELSAAEQSKVTLLEAAMGYAGNYTYNDANNFSSGICGYGDFSKTNNPNYEDGYVDVELAAIEFFGPTTWDTMLTDFNDATVTSELDAAGLTNAGGCFATVGSAANAAIDIAFVWKGIPATDPMGIWNQLASDTFNNTVTSSVTGVSNGVTVTAEIADGTTSPYQGECCMGHEFDSTDADGLRSSALYVYEGWMNVTGSRVALTALGDFDCADAPAAAQYDVGSQDLIYKLNHGYISYAQSQDDVLVNDTGDPSGDGPVAKGWAYDIDAYNVLAAPASC
jgi:Cellulose binding domain